MPVNSQGRASPSGAGFPSTRWSLVELAAGEGGEALERLCEAYWYPLYAFARRSGQAPADAEDVTQGFFHKLLEKGWLDQAEPEKGRLRTFLLTAFRRYMANEWRRDQAQVRGGGWSRVSWDQVEGERRYASSTTDMPPEELYNLHWVLVVMERALAGIEEEFAQRGRQQHFDVLKSVLMLDKQAIDYTPLAERLGMTEGAARVAVHRLRKRFRQRFRDEVAATLEPGADLEEELLCLTRALGG